MLSRRHTLFRYDVSLSLPCPPCFKPSYPMADACLHGQMKDGFQLLLNVKRGKVTTQVRRQAGFKYFDNSCIARRFRENKRYVILFFIFFCFKPNRTPRSSLQCVRVCVYVLGDSAIYNKYIQEIKAQAGNNHTDTNRLPFRFLKDN